MNEVQTRSLFPLTPTLKNGPTILRVINRLIWTPKCLQALFLLSDPGEAGWGIAQIIKGIWVKSITAMSNLFQKTLLLKVLEDSVNGSPGKADVGSKLSLTYPNDPFPFGMIGQLKGNQPPIAPQCCVLYRIKQIDVHLHISSVISYLPTLSSTYARRFLSLACTFPAASLVFPSVIPYTFSRQCRASISLESESCQYGIALYPKGYMLRNPFRMLCFAASLQDF